MRFPLFMDLKNDPKCFRNLIKVFIFIILLLLLDRIVSIAILKGINLSYGITGNSQVLLIGHSHLMLAIDKDMLEKHSGLKVAKYTREGVNISDRFMMLKHYFTTCERKPEIVVLSVDPWIFTGEGLSKNSFLLFLPFMDTPEVKDYIKKSVPHNYDYLRAEVIRSSRFNAFLLNASVRGYLKNWDNFKIGVVDTSKLINELTRGNYRRITFNKDLMNDFSGMLEYLKDENVMVILLNTPVYIPLINVQKDSYQKVMYIIDSISSSRCPKAKSVDLLPLFSENSTLFFDPIHLNPNGQRVVTEYFSVILDSIRKGKMGYLNNNKNQVTFKPQY